MPQILLVDDESGLRTALSRILASEGYDVMPAGDGRSALALMEETSFDAVVSDIRMPEMDGMALLRAIRSKDLDVPVLFLTGSPAVETAMMALEYGAFRYLFKPVDAEALLVAVGRAVQTKRLAALRREIVPEVDGHAPGDRAGLEARFALGMQKLWMAMQPILSWRTRAVFAYEALLRTDEPAMSNPSFFLDAADRLGSAADLGRQVRRCIAGQLEDLPSRVRVFVNVRPADLVDDELLSTKGALTPFAHRVVLEVTERAALDQVHGVVSAVRRLRELGFRIALDDLGAGYAGLSSFALLEPDIVKVDMSLIRDVHQSPTKQKLFRSLAGLCREIGTPMIAEGVETIEERDCLTQLGGDLYQGYLFARPGRGFAQPVV